MSLQKGEYVSPSLQQTAGNPIQWSIFDLELAAQDDHDWWTFPVQAVFSHGETEVVVDGFWNGGNVWRVRFTFPFSGIWKWTTRSEDAGLDGVSGEINVEAPSETQVAENSNYRGHVRISGNGRYFEYDDGTPCFILADTLWAGNSARCGLGENKDGPFFQYLANRKAKGFTTILMQYMRGFGDTTNEKAGQRNEGGYPFGDGVVDNLNPSFFQMMDRRMDALWFDGWVVATPVTWFGKRNCFFSLEWAKRISAYLMVRYGAYNAIWSLSGEYQYAMVDCGWTDADVNELGDAVQAHNAFKRPVSIHPSGRIDWPAPHDVQSSKPFHESAWLDHHWLQTGQAIGRMFYIPIRCKENRALRPVRPVFCSEAYYERPLEIDPDGPYHSRWQAWSAFLNGACGYGYGAFGLWQFLDLDDPVGETGKQVPGAVPWRDAIAFAGSSYLKPVRDTLANREWWTLESCRELLRVDGEVCSFPTEDDLSSPQAGVSPDKFLIVYIPRGNAARVLEIVEFDGNFSATKWIDPRSGRVISVDAPFDGQIPERPDPADEDWVFVVE